MTADKAARTASLALGRSPYSKGAEKLARDLENTMPADNQAERNNHLEHCRNKVAGWSMRDVLDFLHQRCATVEDYKLCAGSDEMGEVDARNRDRAAKFMAGLPEVVTFPIQNIDEAYIARAVAFFNAGGLQWEGGDGWGFWFANGTMSFGACSWCCKNAHAQTIARCRGDAINAIRRLYIAGKNKELGAECVIV